MPSLERLAACTSLVPEATSSWAGAASSSWVGAASSWARTASSFASSEVVVKRTTTANTTTGAAVVAHYLRTASPRGQSRPTLLCTSGGTTD